MEATYSKLKDGTWGARVITDEPLSVGTSIIVTKRSGEQKTETVKEVLWHVRETCLCRLGVATPGGSNRHISNLGPSLAYADEPPSYMDMPQRHVDAQGNKYWKDAVDD
jgi:hypothetical protein